MDNQTNQQGQDGKDQPGTEAIGSTHLR